MRLEIKGLRERGEVGGDYGRRTGTDWPLYIKAATPLVSLFSANKVRWRQQFLVSEHVRLVKRRFNICDRGVSTFDCAPRNVVLGFSFQMPGGVTVKDVCPHDFINALAAHLKKYVKFSCYRQDT